MAPWHRGMRSIDFVHHVALGGNRFDLYIPGVITRSFSSTYNVCAQVDEKDRNGANGQGKPSNDVDQKGAELSDVLGQGIGDGFLQVVKDQATWGRCVSL